MLKTRIISIQILILNLLLGIPCFSKENTDIVLNPKPNLIEKNYGELIVHRTICGDLGNDDVYLFSPFDLAGDADGHLWVFDNLQARVIHLDKNLQYISSFGRAGNGPDGFSRGSMGCFVHIHVGQDRHIYANDITKKVLKVFNPSGDYVNSVPYRLPDIPEPPTSFRAVDKKGNFYFLIRKGNRIFVVNRARKPYFDIQGEKADFGFLYFKPSQAFLTYYQIPEKTDVFVLEERMYLYLKNSSVLYIRPLEKGTSCRRYLLHPKNALRIYQTRLEEIKKWPDSYQPFFIHFFPDLDSGKHFYLHLGREPDGSRNLLYKFSNDGNLDEVLFCRDPQGSFTRFRLKMNDTFYGIQDEKIMLYKEKQDDN